MDIKDLDKKNDLRKLDEKLELVTENFSEDVHNITDTLISEKAAVTGQNLDDVCSYMYNTLTDFRRNIIDYLNKYR